MKRILCAVTVMAVLLCACDYSEIVDTVLEKEAQMTQPTQPEKSVAATEATEAVVVPMTEAATEAADVDFSSLSNTTNGWGFKRQIPQRPGFTSAETATMAKYGCMYMGSPDEKVMYLTFDEGYENGYTPLILDTLREKNVRAAFFVTGPYLRQHADLVKRMVDEGHIVGNHTNNHQSLPSCSVEEIEEELLSLEKQYYDMFHLNMKYMRPPMGEYSERSLAVTASLGYTSVFWSSAYADWDTNAQKGADYAYRKVTENFHNGSVILLHAVSKDNTEALGEIIDTARDEGYEFRTLDEYF
ncbi:MAG: polysaccharide deacetylase family protein [Clostridia bacterium]|nr:polysaccharide deacetylase family protein [Clostridia bacterium]